jgi:hypothetical protein
MAFNVNEFRQQITGDGARPNLFEVRMNIPGFAKSQGRVDEKFRFMCNTAQLPGTTLGVAPVFYFGREIKLAGNRTYPEWTVNVINDEDFVIRNSMERWIAAINDPVQNIRNPVASIVDGGYGVDASVVQYGKRGERIKTYDFYGMFPIDISPIEVSWAANDQIEEFSITFAFQYWTTPDADSTVSNILGTVGSVLG